MVFLMACGAPQSFEDSAQQSVFSPRSETTEVELGPGDELRWLFEGAAESRKIFLQLFTLADLRR